MRIVLAQLAPRRGDPAANLARLDGLVTPGTADLWVFPELYLSGYKVGDALHSLALSEGDATVARLTLIAHSRATSLIVGAPLASAERPGETLNAVGAFPADGAPFWQVKRYLPNFGPFEEGAFFTPSRGSRPVRLGPDPVGLSICYDTFFPEVTRELALQGSRLLVIVSAAPVTSGPLFEKLLPARAVENGLPLVYVNRVGVEDGLVFGGGSAAYNARGEVIAVETLPLERAAPEESLGRVTLDLAQAPRWRPFRPVLRDLATRPAGGAD